MNFGLFLVGNENGDVYITDTTNNKTHGEKQDETLTDALIRSHGP